MCSWDRAVAAPSPSGLRVGGKGASAPALCEGVEPVCENWNRPNRFLQKPESFQVGRVGRAFRHELARTDPEATLYLLNPLGT